MFKNKGGMKGSASEMLTVYPMMRRFVASFVVGSAGGSLDSSCAMFIVVCDLIDAIMAAQKNDFGSMSRKVAKPYEMQQSCIWTFL